MRRWWRRYIDALTGETSAFITASSGALWVVGPAVGAALSGSELGAHIRLPFYEISATIIPVLLLAYFVEHAAMTASIARKASITSDSEQRREGEGLLATGRALAALVAANAATGEILALYAVAHGTTSTFLYVAPSSHLSRPGWRSCSSQLLGSASRPSGSTASRGQRPYALGLLTATQTQILMASLTGAIDTEVRIEPSGREAARKPNSIW